MTPPLPPQLILRPTGPSFPARLVLSEYDARHRHHIAADRAHLPEEERALAETIRSEHRRIGFLAGRIALRSALAAHDPAIAPGAVLRDARGRPHAAWSGAPRISIAHTRVRAVAAVAPADACTAIGVDVEELDAHRAHALVRMSLSTDEAARVRATDPAMLAGPIALWCAREACVKAFALEVGWFGTALVATRFEPCDPPAADAARAWSVEIALESHEAMWAIAWESRGAVFAFAFDSRARFNDEAAARP
jgi:4'-phosphopantetheinyl transferase EntD